MQTRTRTRLANENNVSRSIRSHSTGAPKRLQISITDIYQFMEPDAVKVAESRHKRHNHRLNNYTELKPACKCASGLTDVYDFIASPQATPVSILRRSQGDELGDESPRNVSRVSFSEDSIRLAQDDLKTLRDCQITSTVNSQRQAKYNKTSTPIHSDMIPQSKSRERCSFDELTSASPLLSMKRQPVETELLKEQPIMEDISYSDIQVQKKHGVSSSSASSGYSSQTSSPDASVLKSPSSREGRKRSANENSAQPKRHKKISKELLRIKEKERRYLEELLELDKFNLCIG